MIITPGSQISHYRDAAKAPLQFHQMREIPDAPAGVKLLPSIAASVDGVEA